MAKPVITYDDLIGKTDAFDEIFANIDRLRKETVGLVRQTSDKISIVSEKDTEQVRELRDETIRLKKAKELIDKQEVVARQAKKKAIELNKLELIQLEKEREALRKNRTEAKAIAILKNTQANSVENLKAKLKLVTAAWSELSKEELENTKRGQRLVKSKDEITNKIKELQKANKKVSDSIKEKNKLTDEEIKASIQIKIADKERLDTLKAEVIIENESSGIKEKLAAKNKLLRIERSKLTDETKDGRKAIKRINKEINENTRRIADNSDELEQNKMNVGNYTQSVRKAILQTGAWAASLFGLSKGMSGLQSAVDSNTEGSKELEKVQGRIGATTGVVTNAIGATILKLWDAGKALVQTGGNTRVAGQALSNLGSDWEGLGNKITKATEASDKATDQNYELNKIIRDQSEAIARLNGLADQQNAIAGDTTKTFEEQAEANRRATNAAKTAAVLQNELYSQQLDILNQRIAGVSGLTLAEVKSLKTQELISKSSVNINALLTERNELNLQLIDSENAVTVAVLDNAKVNNEIRRDVYERQLDFAIDAFDSQKTVNERIIADERTVLEDKKRILEETVELTNNSFKNQIKLTESYVGRKLELDELVKINDEEEIRRKLEIAKFDDITAGRILEIIKERKFALQDISDLQKEVADEQQRYLEADQALEEFRQEVAVAKKQELIQDVKDNKKRIKMLKDLEAEEIYLENLKADNLLDNQSLLESERQKIIEESEEKIRQIKRDSLAEQSKDAKTSISKIADELQSIGDLIIDQIVKISKRQIELSENRLSKQEEAVNRQYELAKEGGANTLKFELEEQAKREAELVKSQKRLERAEKAKALYSSYSKTGDIGKTLRDFAILEGLTAGFKKGGYTGDGGKHDVKGYVHAKEFVLDSETTEQLGLRNKDMNYFNENIAIHEPRTILETPQITFQRKQIPSIESKVNIDLKPIVSELQALRQIQESTPRQNIELGRITDNMFEFLEKVTTKNKTEINRHIIKRQGF